MNTLNTLLGLLSEYSVIIPRVQRDYVQGRKDEYTTIVRTNLLIDIRKAINGETDPLDLNFVYGKTTEDGKCFFPVDGQQRLTTLFLLHVYAYADDDSKDNLLLKFSYQARSTTCHFFEELVKNKNQVFDHSELPESMIRDASWFIDSWKYDPSINNALNTLNDISRMGFDRSVLKKQLEETVAPRVFFQFVKNLDELGMEDDLYIKLNARGRALTAFENFKSRFVDRCTEAAPSFSDEIKRNLDGTWADTIWGIGKSGNDRFDDFYLRFFETVFQNCGLLKTEANKKASENWIYNFDYNSITAELISAISNTFNYLAINETSEAYALIIDAIKKESPYPDKVMFHSVFLYLSDETISSDVDDQLLNDWLRVFMNLVRNSRIEEADVYIRAIGSMNSLIPQKNTVLDFLAAGSITELPGFQKEQFEEECQKARIICRSIDHKNAIIQAEKELPYFGGQIRSALYFSDLEKNNNLVLFKEYVRKLSVLFDYKKPFNGLLLRRALCSIGDYRLTVGNYKTLCIDDPNESSKSWSLKTLFSNHGREVQTVLEAIDPSKPIESQLQTVIAQHPLSQKDWRYCLVNYGETLFPLMSNSHLRMTRNKHEDLLVPNKQSNGDNYSVYLFTLKVVLQNEGIVSEYKTEKGAWGKRYLIIQDAVITFENQSFIIEQNSELWATQGENIIDEAKNYVMEIIKQA